MLIIHTFFHFTYGDILYFMSQLLSHENDVLITLYAYALKDHSNLFLTSFYLFVVRVRWKLFDFKEFQVYNVQYIDKYTNSNGIIYHKLHLQRTIVKSDNMMMNNAIFCAFWVVVTMSSTASGKLTKTKMMDGVRIKLLEQTIVASQLSIICLIFSIEMLHRKTRRWCTRHIDGVPHCPKCWENWSVH